ncbi:MAG: hypothetical protein FJ265_10825 [Planctomycetes bacterium]|nr:hypothetical protein [Planctomycetota bacterium]
MRALPFLLFAAHALAQVQPAPLPAPPPTPLPAVLPVQLQAQLPADLEALAQRVEKAHHPQGKVEPVTAFQGTFELHLLDAKAAQGGQVDVAFQYLEWRREDSKVRHLIRYVVRDAATPVESGRDRYGFWQLFQGKARDLTEADSQDRAACERNTGLALQLVRFLHAGQVLRSLAAPSAVQQESFQLGREPPIVCEAVRGGLPAFPLLQQGGEGLPVSAKVFVAKATGQLVAVEATPLVDGAPDPGRTELVRLGDLREQDGFLVPRHLLHLRRDQDGKLRPVTRAVITSLALRPGLREEDLRRPGG